MKKLQNCFKLGSKITIYVPSTVDVDKQVSNTKYVNAIADIGYLKMVSWLRKVQL